MIGSLLLGNVQVRLGWVIGPALAGCDCPYRPYRSAESARCGAVGRLDQDRTMIGQNLYHWCMHAARAVPVTQPTLCAVVKISFDYVGKGKILLYFNESVDPDADIDGTGVVLRNISFPTAGDKKLKTGTFNLRNKAVFNATNFSTGTQTHTCDFSMGSRFLIH